MCTVRYRGLIKKVGGGGEFPRGAKLLGLIMSIMYICSKYTSMPRTLMLLVQKVVVLTMKKSYVRWQKSWPFSVIKSITVRTQTSIAVVTCNLDWLALHLKFGSVYI